MPPPALPGIAEGREEGGVALPPDDDEEDEDADDAELPEEEELDEEEALDEPSSSPPSQGRLLLLVPLLPGFPLGSAGDELLLGDGSHGSPNPAARPPIPPVSPGHEELEAEESEEDDADDDEEEDSEEFDDDALDDCALADELDSAWLLAAELDSPPPAPAGTHGIQMVNLSPLERLPHRLNIGGTVSVSLPSVQMSGFSTRSFPRIRIPFGALPLTVTFRK